MRTSGIFFSFVSSPDTEKERFLYSCCNVASGFYSRHGWLVLPRPVKNFEKFCEVIPEIAMDFSSNFWKDASIGGNLMPKVISKRMWEESKNIIFEKIDQKIVNKFKNDWEKIEKISILALQNIFPTEVKWIKSIEVRITNIGSFGSHYLLSKKRNQHLVIYLRTDSNSRNILNLLILALIYPLANELQLSFTQRQIVRNFIMTRPLFKKIYTDFKHSTFDKPKVPDSLRIQSDEYIKHLKIPNIIDPITEINKNLSLFGVKESTLLKKLIEKRGEIIDYDQIADLIWGEGKFKSYWAINKLVQRIQKKINFLDIILKIDGARGKGYILK